jgi:WhiB family redox-sensing transcriptional regulator
LDVLSTPVPCRSSPERWWATPATPAGESAQAEAVAGCMECAVRVECVAYAVAATERFGVWGGLRPADRRPR